jgi:hypothetical protein
MLINHECIKDLLTVFAESELADLSIQSVVNVPHIKEKYADEELMFHVQRLVDSQWIITTSKNKEPYALYETDRVPSWSVTEWRWTESASKYWDASNQPEIWTKFKSMGAKESLEFSLDLLKGIAKKWIEKQLDSIE